MKLLAFDTSTEALSIAVGWEAGGRLERLEHSGPGGAQASATLIPAVQDLLRRAGLRLQALDAIVFGRGPGSFTGLRTACSVAQGLAFGANVPVLPVDTLMALAEQARIQQGATQVVALLDARMDEVYSAAYAFGDGVWRQQGEFRLGRPEALEVPPGWVLAGNAFKAYGDRLPAAADRIEALPTAAALLALAPALLAAGRAVDAAGALPLYIRDKVAQTTQERADARALAAGPP
ncbi:tRNA (adenosine(37)-N6)-threonylcarbamoyltransferase complex dimerization subunit type 1 TsaB [uncultured Ramlibacter sp.]|uniref:tRNA (adenosine(37)-N6)-threonylcarbamoyltransferase complex dimerization subunit type 1 TsaB n=1 Tax=uncultured Ramlibacter sp. TaxID=260755 RepID=UPI002610A77B|nr:tRNA (adenosine(37)-N6)-threonylcarbamoyltransferase complex dimerization subunit type 1 TsaB [uncultured Ramlibacter sp.]